MTELQTSGMILSWDETIQCLISKRLGYSSEDKFKIGLTSLLELFKQKNSSKLLTDMSETAPFSKEVQTWIEQEWLPQMIAAGLKTQAFVIPKNALARMIMDKAVPSGFSQGREVAFFDSQEAAKEWLLSHGN